MPELSATVAKVATVAADANQLESQANQDVITVSAVTNGYEVEVTDVASYTDGGSTVTASTAEGLFEFAQIGASNDYEWILLAITTDESLLNVKLDGTALTQDDIDAATALGYTGGKTLILWVKYTDLVDVGKTIVLSTVDETKSSKSITFIQA